MHDTYCKLASWGWDATQTCTEKGDNEFGVSNSSETIRKYPGIRIVPKRETNPSQLSRCAEVGFLSAPPGSGAGEPRGKPWGSGFPDFGPGREGRLFCAHSPRPHNTYAVTHHRWAHAFSTATVACNQECTPHPHHTASTDARDLTRLGHSRAHAPHALTHALARTPRAPPRAHAGPAGRRGAGRARPRVPRRARPGEGAARGSRLALELFAGSRAARRSRGARPAGTGGSGREGARPGSRRRQRAERGRDAHHGPEGGRRRRGGRLRGLGRRDRRVSRAGPDRGRGALSELRGGFSPAGDPPDPRNVTGARGFSRRIPRCLPGGPRDPWLPPAGRAPPGGRKVEGLKVQCKPTHPVRRCRAPGGCKDPLSASLETGDALALVSSFLGDFPPVAPEHPGVRPWRWGEEEKQGGTPAPKVFPKSARRMAFLVIWLHRGTLICAAESTSSTPPVPPNFVTSKCTCPSRNRWPVVPAG